MNVIIFDGILSLFFSIYLSYMLLKRDSEPGQKIRFISLIRYNLVRETGYFRVVSFLQLYSFYLLVVGVSFLLVEDTFLQTDLGDIVTLIIIIGPLLTAALFVNLLYGRKH